MIKYTKTKNNILKKITKTFFLFIHFTTLLSVFIALMSKFIPAEKSYIPYLFSLIFPFTFLYLLISTIIISFKKYYISIIITIPIVVWAFAVFNRYINFTNLFLKEDCNNKDSIKIMTFNVRLFDLYNWKNNHENYKNILDFIIKEQPDIACFQEYYYQSDGKYPTTDTLLKELRTKYIHNYFPIVLRKKDFFGIATISKYPIVNQGIIKFNKTSNSCIYVDIVKNNDTIRIYNMHLESVRLGVEDYIFISSLEKSPDSLELNKTKSLIKRLIKAAIERNRQAQIIAKSIEECKYPVIVCGDFNDIPASYTYSTISKNLVDTYKNFDFTLGSTYNGNIPFIRIDYIFHSPDFVSCKHTIHKVNYSDHYPVTAILYKTK